MRAGDIVVHNDDPERILLMLNEELILVLSVPCDSRWQIGSVRWRSSWCHYYRRIA